MRYSNISNKPLRAIMLSVGIIFLIPITAWAQAPSIDWDLDEAIRQIERQADDFDSMMARVLTVTKDADGNEVGGGTGTGFIHRDGRMRYNADGGKFVSLVDKKSVTEYRAESNVVTEYSLRKNKNRIEPFVRLGFSTTGKELKDDYLITIRGEEEIGDARTLLLELTPEKDKTRETVRLVRLWINQASWMPVQQEFSLTDGNTITHTFTGMARNLKLNPDLFRENWPRDAEKVKK